MKTGSPRSVFAALWDAALREASNRDLGSAASVRALAKQAGEDALGCISAVTVQDEAALVVSSASLLSAVTLLWAARGIEPDEIWMELHKRERLGSLLHEMAKGQLPSKQRSLGRPWRVNSTKLP